MENIMSTLDDNKFDVFIAFHGDEETGSVRIAREIYDFLMDNKIKAYFHPATNPNGKFSQTPIYVMRSMLFLLVANSNIPTDGEGHIQSEDSEGNKKYLYEEIEAMRSANRAAIGTIAKCRLFISDDFDQSKADKLDPCFSGAIYFRYRDTNWKKQVLDWIMEAKAIMGVSDVNDSDAQETIVQNNDNLWDADVAAFWKNINPPSRPAPQEISYYQEELKKISNPNGQKKMLILGTTNEFRVLGKACEFEITIVDFSRLYYQNRTKQLIESGSNYDQTDVDKEKVVFCRWDEMCKNDDLKSQIGTFDVIVGDLAIGNVSPEHLEATISAISEMLNKDGLFIFKDLFAFDISIKQKEFKKEQIKKIISEDLSETCSLKDAFARSMYLLSILARENTGECSRINYSTITKIIKDLHDQGIITKKHPLYKIYASKDFIDGTAKINFYVYELKKITKLLYQYNLCLKDSVYCDTIYCRFFPIMTFQKKESSDRNFLLFNQTTTYDDIGSDFSYNIFTNDINDMWIKYLPAQYYIIRLCAELESTTISNKEKIYQEIKSTLSEKIKPSINVNLCFEIEYDDETMNEEYKSISGASADIQESMSKLYKHANILYLTLALIKEKNFLSHVIFDRLFLDVQNGYCVIRGNGKTYRVPWIPAKICLSGRSLMTDKEMKEAKASNMEAVLNMEKKKLIELVHNICNDFDTASSIWKCDVGSKKEALSLCAETLIAYYKNLDEAYQYKVQQIFKRILENFILYDNIYETIAVYPIGTHIMQSIIADNENKTKINGELLHKKFLSRIEFFAILYRIMFFMSEHGFGNFTNEKKVLDMHLKQFWMNFKQNSDLQSSLTKKEVLSVPQIYYVLVMAAKS